MNEKLKTNAIILQRGNYYLGCNIHKSDGSIERKPPRFEPDTEGSCVIVSDFDTDKDATVGEADLFACWDTQGMNNKIIEKLAINCRNFPTPEEIYKWTKNYQNGLEFCDICESVCAGYDCSICPIQTIKDEEEEQEK